MDTDKTIIPEVVTTPAKESLPDKLCRMSFAVNQPNYSLPEMKEIKQSGGYLTYGEFNDYPQSLINMLEPLYRENVMKLLQMVCILMIQKSRLSLINAIQSPNPLKTFSERLFLIT
jgi:hypothetical protein